MVTRAVVHLVRCACDPHDLAAVFDKVTSTVSDHALEKLESLPEEQASRAVANAREADARSAGDAAVWPPRVPGPRAGGDTVLRLNKSPACTFKGTTVI